MGYHNPICNPATSPLRARVARRVTGRITPGKRAKWPYARSLRPLDPNPRVRNWYLPMFLVQCAGQATIAVDENIDRWHFTDGPTRLALMAAHAHINRRAKVG
jgi:hypothetical protein